MRKQYFVANNLLGECAGPMQMTVISEGLLLNSNYIIMGREEEGFQAFLTQPPLVLFAMWFNGYPFKLFDSLNYQIYTSHKVFNKNSLLLCKRNLEQGNNFLPETTFIVKSSYDVISASRLPKALLFEIVSQV